MNEEEIAFIIAAIELGHLKKTELRSKLNPENKLEKELLNYLDDLEYSSNANSTK